MEILFAVIENAVVSKISRNANQGILEIPIVKLTATAIKANHMDRLVTNRPAAFSQTWEIGIVPIRSLLHDEQ